MKVYYNEFDKRKAAALRVAMRRGLIPKGVIDERSIELVQARELEGFDQCHFFAGIGVWAYVFRLAGWPESAGPTWTASCPCQPFSQSGQRQAENDHRHLWPVLFKLFQARKPFCAFGEQVSSLDGLGWLDIVHNDLDAENYTLGVLDTCAAGAGAPMLRQRLYWYAVAGLGDSGSSGLSVGHEEFTRSGDVVGLGDPKSFGRRRGTNNQNEGRRKCASTDRSAPFIVGDFWKGHNWVLTRPDRVADVPGLRPVEPGAFPLADGTAERVGRLHGYGDAIVAPQAAAFVRSVMIEFGLV